jgi:hypothetical protein
MQGVKGYVLWRESLRTSVEQVMLVYPDPGDGLEYFVFIKAGIVVDRRRWQKKT